jgi:hypothetical protein
MASYPKISRLGAMDRLWILVILGMLFIIGCVRSLPPNDLWWHARIGSEILDSGQIPRHDTFSLTERGEPFFYQSWLAEVVMAGLIRLGGVRLLVLVRALIMVGLFGAVMGLCWWASGEDRRAAVPMTLAAILLGLGNQTVRPQLFAYPLFIVAFAVLWRYTRGGARRLVWSVPLLFLVWVNLHGSFALGLGLVWLFFLGELMSQRLPALAGRPPTHSRDWERVKTLGLVALFSTVALLVNPRGVEILGYVADLLTDAPSQLLGEEWQPADPKTGLGGAFYFVFLSGVAALAFARTSIPLTDLTLFLAFAWLAASGLRYVIWFGLVGAPILTGVWSRFPWVDVVHWKSRLARHHLGRRLLYGDGSGYPGFRRLALVVIGGGGVLALFLLLLHPGDGPWLTPYTGSDAVGFMEANGVQGRLFNELGRGSYLIWALGPSQPVFIDPRFELYSLDHFWDYVHLSRADEGTAALMEKYGFDLLLLGHEFQARLMQWVEARPEQWDLLYQDRYTRLYRRLAE